MNVDTEIIFVAGAGRMGREIAQRAALAGFGVILCDVREEWVNKGLRVIGANLSRSLAEGNLSALEKAAAMFRIETTCGMERAREADLVIEAVTENREIKTALLQELDRVCETGVIFASCTSTFSVDELAAAADRPERVIGLHFADSSTAMECVEIVKGALTSDETYETIACLVERMGLSTVSESESPSI